MKPRLLLLAILVQLPLWSLCQTQQGYVKTKGRMVNGQHMPGQGLKGATVSVRGRTTVVVNSDDGSFSFPANSQFQLDSVRKKGYQLVDMDACPRIYKQSSNPLYIVMETPEQQLQDQLTAERKIRRNLQKQLQDKEDEIENLKAQQKITDEEYYASLQKLYHDQENNEQLIKDMAKRYSELDYDQLDEFYRQVSFCIENGELVKADSLLKTKGDVTAQVEEQLRRGVAIKEQEEQLNQAKAVHVADQEELAKRCYSYYETFAAQHLNDTAAYYLELRASLDTTNIVWQNDAADFIRLYIADYNKALGYYSRMLRGLQSSLGENHPDVATAYNRIGIIYEKVGQYDQSLEYNNKALAIRLAVLGESHPDVAESYNNLSNIYYNKAEYAQALEYQLQALTIFKSTYGELHPNVATCYNNVGFICFTVGDFEHAMEYMGTALETQLSIYGEKHLDVALSYMNIGSVYYGTGDYEKALEYFIKALNIRRELLGEKHPDVATGYNNIGLIYFNQGNGEKALEYYSKSQAVWKSVFGELHPYVAIGYINIGMAHIMLGDYSKALEYFETAYPIEEQVFGPDDIRTVKVKEKIEELKDLLKE